MQIGTYQIVVFAIQDMGKTLCTQIVLCAQLDARIAVILRHVISVFNLEIFLTIVLAL